jgi:FMN phosphatase YigB (HAD superfamily)
LDRGRGLRLRLEAIEAGTGRSFAAAFEQLAAERGYRWARPGAEALRAAVSACRAFADVAPALERATRAGLGVTAVADADATAVHAALRPLDGAVHAVVCARAHGDERGPAAALARALGRSGAARTLHVATGPEQLAAAARLGVRAAWLNRAGAAPWPGTTFCAELRSLHDLADLAARRAAVTTG